MKPIAFIVLIFLFLGTGCQHQQSETERNATPGAFKLTLVYYAIPNCSNCARITAFLKQLERDKSGQIHVVVQDATTPAGKADRTMYQLGSHGLLIFDNQDQLLKAIPGHFLSNEFTARQIDSLLALYQ